MTLLLASVTGPAEAEIAVTHGADIVDLKDPTRGALGAVPADIVREAVGRVAGRRPTSAVCGDLPMEPEGLVAAVSTMASSVRSTLSVRICACSGRSSRRRLTGTSARSIGS